MSTMHYQDRRPPQEPSLLSSSDCKRIIIEGDAKVLTACAQTIGTGLAGQLTASQIRNVFGTVRQIETIWGRRTTPVQQAQAARQLILLKPKLAYQAKRLRSRGMEELVRVLVPAIDLVGDRREHFQNFVDFFEAIVAYHVAAGG